MDFFKEEKLDLLLGYVKVMMAPIMDCYTPLEQHELTMKQFYAQPASEFLRLGAVARLFRLYGQAYLSCLRYHFFTKNELVLRLELGKLETFLEEVAVLPKPECPPVIRQWLNQKH